MRIISGKYKGRHIPVPSSFKARPTTDFAREGLFNILANTWEFEGLAVLDLFARKPGFETTEFRDALGVSRKFAVPLLDYFDTVRLTVRRGSRRTPGAEARRALAENPKGG